MAHLVSGSVELTPVADGRFPYENVVAGGVVVASVGRMWWASVFFGRGQKILLPDDRRWRLTSRAWRRYVCPAVITDDGLRVATSAPGTKNYFVTTRDRGLLLNPAEAPGGRARRWQLVDHETEVASLTRRPFTADVYEPIPLGALLLARALMAYGILGEGDLLPTAASWST